MPYIEKTLIEDEKIIVFKRSHWFFWLSPSKVILVLIKLIALFFMIKALFTEGANIMLPLVVYCVCSFGLLCYFIQYISTENAVTNKRVIFKTGFIKTDTDELRKERIENIQIKQSLLGKIFRYGDLEFKGTGGSPVVFRLIEDPISVKKEIETVLFKN